MTERIILKIFGEKKALQLFGIRPKKATWKFTMGGSLFTYMTTELNKH